MRWSGRSTFGLPVIFCTKSSPCSKTSRQIRTSWSACEVCGRSLTAKIKIFGKRPVSFSCSYAYFAISLMILRLLSGAVMSRSTADASNVRSSSSLSSASRPVCVSIFPISSPSFRKTPLIRTFEWMLTGS